MQQSPQNVWSEIVTRKVERDGWVELCPELAQDDPGPAPAYRARVLWVDADRNMGVERPPFVGVDRQLCVGRKIHVRLSEGGTRLRAGSRIAKVRSHQLNARTRLIALALDPPSEIRSDQRREFYRVSTQSIELGPIEFSPVRDFPTQRLATEQPLGDENTGAAAALNCRLVKGTLVNISGGGVGVSVPATRGLLDTLPPSRCYTAELPLPDGKPPLRLTLRLVHMKLHQPGRVYFGMQIEEPDANRRAESEERLVRFATTLERQQLRRQRSA